MRLAPVDDGAEVDRQIGEPHDGQPDIDVPFWLGIFLGLGGAEQIARRGQHDEQVIAPEHEPAEIAAPEPHRAGALHDVERGADQRVAAKGKDHRRGVQGPQPPEVRVTLGPAEVQRGKGQLKRDEGADQKSHDAPEGGGDHPCADHAVEISLLPPWRRLAHLPQRPDKQPRRDQHDDDGMQLIGRIMGEIGRNGGQKCDAPQQPEFQTIPHAASFQWPPEPGGGVS